MELVELRRHEGLTRWGHVEARYSVMGEESGIEPRLIRYQYRYDVLRIQDLLRSIIVFFNCVFN